MASDENGIDWKVGAVDWRNRYHGALKLMAERDKPCVWTRGYDKEIDIRSFVCGCTQDWYGNAPAFCPNCGHPVEVAA